MKAAVSTAIGKIEIQDIPQPVLNPGEALIHVHFSGICGSDIFAFQNGDPFAAFPHVFGHEASGTLVELCGETDRFRIGDNVVYEITLGCGQCQSCRENRPSDCRNIKIIGGHLPGAFAEYVKVPYHLIHKIPNDMPLDLAAVCEPYTVAARGCARGRIGPGDNVLILGAGNIALCTAAVAKELGAAVILAARSETRLERAKLFGPDAVINTSQENVHRRLDKLTGGNGCDVILEATGSKEMIEAAVEYATRATRIVIIGICGEQVNLPASSIVTKELQIIGSQNSFGQYPWVIEKLSQGKLHAREFITDVFPFKEALSAMEYAIANSGRCGKVLIRFT